MTNEKIERCFHYIENIDAFLKSKRKPFCDDRLCDGYNIKCQDYLVWKKESENDK